MAGGNLNRGYAPIFIAAGNQYHIPPSVLAGVADVETNGGANISTSSTGAQGLMQFEPATARSLGVNPMDPRSAIFGAARLLNQYGYQSNPTRAIGAYNGGPGNPQYGYAQQVLANAARLKPQFAGVTASLPGTPSSMSGGSRNSGGTTIATTSNVLDQAAFQKATAASIAGNFVKNNSKSPYDVGPKTGLGSGTAPLFSSGLLTTAAPNPADYQVAQTTLQHIAGTPMVAHPGAMSGHLSGTGYVSPIPGASLGRTDMGVDANLPSGHPIVALGDSRVIGFSPNWYRGQPYMLLQLLNGPQAGKYWYVAEAINPTVHTGQVVRAGQTIGTYNSGGTGLELGWGSSTPGRTLAQATTGYTEGQVTSAGTSFRNFLGGLH